MNRIENITAPKVNVITSFDVIDKPFTDGAFIFNMKKIIKGTKITNSSGIYTIQSKINNNGYIGSACNLKRRKREHFNDLKINKHCNKHLQNHANKYGLSDLVFEIMEFCPNEILVKREQYWTDTLNPEFNIQPRAGSPLGYHHTEETKIKMRKPHGNMSEEQKRVLSEVGMGRISWCKGLTNETDERIKNCSIKRTGQKRSIEAKDKMRKSHLGKKWSEETREKHKHYHPTKATIQKKRETNIRKGIRPPIRTGWHHSKKTKELMRQAQLSQILLICPYCGYQSNNHGSINRYHFNNCKYKPQN